MIVPPFSTLHELKSAVPTIANIDASSLVGSQRLTARNGRSRFRLEPYVHPVIYLSETRA